MRAHRLSARWVIPQAGPPIEDGAVLLGADGRIEAVGPDHDVPRSDAMRVEPFGDAVLLPGLVNTHTHLELTGMGGRKPEPEFAAWIRALRQAKAARSPESVLDAARRGLRDCWAAGVTTVADTGDSGAVVQALAEAGASGIVYHEVFGPHPDQRTDSYAGLLKRVEDLGRYAGGRVRLGVSPHAPYTVSGPLYREVAAWARSAGIPTAVHIAESAAESALLARGAGPFAEAWQGRGIPLPSPRGDTPIGWLDRHGVLSERTLCIHVVRADMDDIGRMARAGVSVAHCPRSNDAHGHGPAPLPALLEAGLRLGVGTDSVASVGTLDLLAEARAAQCLGGLSASRMLGLCTIDGARALGLDGETGSLVPGKWGDLIVVRGAPDAARPEEFVLASGPKDVLATFVGGRDVYRTGRPL